MQLRLSLAAALLALATLPALAGDALNTLTAAEQKAGWKLLWDGKSLDGWRGFKKTEAPKQGWEIHDGVLKCVAAGKGGDIITDKTYDDFELSWEWSMPEKSNNGVKYFITEERSSAIGHEYQMIDDSLVKDHAESSTASFYLVVAPDPAKKHVKPFGEWNQSRVLVKGNHVEHWLNGEKVVEYECGDAKILALVQKTKFKDVAGFGTKLRGHILLTYHNDECSFRNVKLRELSAK